MMDIASPCRHCGFTAVVGKFPDGKWNVACLACGINTPKFSSRDRALMVWEHNPGDVIRDEVALRERVRAAVDKFLAEADEIVADKNSDPTEYRVWKYAAKKLRKALAAAPGKEGRDDEDNLQKEAHDDE